MVEVRCPRLGHPVPLAYCYQQPEGRPCGRIMVCWEWMLPGLRRVLERLVPAEKWKEYFETPPPPKAVSLLEEINRAQGERHGDEDLPQERGEGNGP